MPSFDPRRRAFDVAKLKCVIRYRCCQQIGHWADECNINPWNQHQNQSRHHGNRGTIWGRNSFPRPVFQAHLADTTAYLNLPLPYIEQIFQTFSLPDYDHTVTLNPHTYLDSQLEPQYTNYSDLPIDSPDPYHFENYSNDLTSDTTTTEPTTQEF